MRKTTLVITVLLLAGLILAGAGCGKEPSVKPEDKGTGEETESQLPEPQKDIKVEELGSGQFVISPSSAICGYKIKTKPYLPAGKFDVSSDCLDGVLKEDDDAYGHVSQPDEKRKDELGVGVAEIYFEVPQNISDESILSATVDLKLICSSGLGLYFLTEFEEWARFGEDLPSDEYKPDGSYGYLSCRYGAKERKAVSLPIKIHNHKAGVRIVKEEATAYALIDSVKLNIVCSKE